MRSELRDDRYTAQDLMENVLRFCYMGACQVPKHSVLDVLLLADRFDVPALQAVCEKVRSQRGI